MTNEHIADTMARVRKAIADHPSESGPIVLVACDHPLGFWPALSAITYALTIGDDGHPTDISEERFRYMAHCWQ